MQPLVQPGGQPVVAPLDQVVVVDAEQHLGRGVVVAALVAQLELGQLRAQVIQALPVLPRGAGLLEVAGAVVPQRLPGEGRRVGLPVGGFSVGQPGQGVVAVHLVQVVAAGLAADELHVHQPA